MFFTKKFLATGNTGKCRRKAKSLEREWCLARFGDEFSHGAPESANNAVFFQGKDCAGIAQSRAQCRVVKRPERVHAKHASVQALYLEQIGGPDGGLQHSAGGNNG